MQSKLNGDSVQVTLNYMNMEATVISQDPQSPFSAFTMQTPIKCKTYKAPGAAPASAHGILDQITKPMVVCSTDINRENGTYLSVVKQLMPPGFAPGYKPYLLILAPVKAEDTNSIDTDEDFIIYYGNYSQEEKRSEQRSLSLFRPKHWGDQVTCKSI